MFNVRYYDTSSPLISHEGVALYYPLISLQSENQCSVHDSSPLVFVLNQINPVYNIPSYFFNINFKTILHTMSRSSK
jgi:hypothetical protein